VVSNPRSKASTVSAQQLSIGVVGGGALGLIYAGLAARSGQARNPVRLLTRQAELARRSASEGINLSFAAGEFPDQSFSAAEISVIGEDEAAAASGLCDLVFVLSRTYDSAYAVAAAKALLAPGGYAVTLQNGLTAWDELRRNDINYLAGVTYTGGSRTAANRALCTRHGGVVLGSDPQKQAAAERAAHFLEACGISCEIGGSEATVLWRKVFMTTINWVCGVVGASVKDVIRCPQARPLFVQAMQELVPIAAVDGALVDWGVQISDLDEFLKVGGAAFGSTYGALQQGQPLEVEEICRSIVARAEVAGLPSACTETYLKLLQVQSSVYLGERESWAKK
jgi:2-dehydropantoate 2-reductase